MEPNNKKINNLDNLKAFCKKNQKKIIIFASILVVIAFACIFLLGPMNNALYANRIQELKNTISTVSTSPKVLEESPKPLVIQEKFKELYEKNKDFVGWIIVDGTDVDYPVMQADDNEYYMKRSFDKEYFGAGSIFLDYRCDITNMFKSAHQIIYGHNMNNGSMFQTLTRYEDEQFFKDHSYITLNTIYGDYQFEIFSVHESPISYYYINTEFNSNDEWLEFIEELQSKSMFSTDIELTKDDVVLTLSTCTNRHDSNYRFVVHARLVNPEEYDTDYTYIYK